MIEFIQFLSKQGNLSALFLIILGIKKKVGKTFALDLLFNIHLLIF